MTRRSFGLCAALICSVSAAAGGTTRYVAVDGNHQSPYTSWANAATSITAAALVSNDGDLIVVSNGVYHLSESQYIRTAPMLTVSGLYSAAETVLDGGGGAFPGIRVGWGCATAHIYNLTVRNFKDGGITCGANEVYLYNCVIESNSASRGGGINVANGGRLYITNSVIRDNEATIANHYAGGGIYKAGAVGTVKVYESTISGNLATNGSYGGGAYVDGVSEFHNCTFSGNKSHIGGGISEGASAVSLRVDGCVFLLNSAASGAGIRAGIAGPNNTDVYNSTIVSNTASSQGGGLYAIGNIVNCYISGNTAGHIGGGIRSATSILNSTIVGNAATNSGGAIYRAALVRNCLIVRNSAGAGDGGGINAENTLVQNCTIVDNSAGRYGGGVAGSGYGTNSIVMFNSALTGFPNYMTMSFAYSCTVPLPAGDGNIAADPMLDEDFRPLRGSPVINAGLYQEWMDDATDLAGNPRILQGTVDIGAYEYVPAATLIMVR